MSFSVSEIKKVLRGYELPEESLTAAANEICSKHTADLSAIGEEKAEAEKLAKAAEKKVAELETAEKELAELKKADYKSQLDAVTAERDKLKTEYEAYKGEQTAKEIKAAKENAVRSYYKDKYHIEGDNLEIAMRGSTAEIEAVELDDSKKIKDTKALDALAGGIYKKFSTGITVKGAETPNPPANNGGSAFDSMTLYQKMQYANEKPNDPAVKAFLGNSK